jgi:hypothetical protein
MKEETNRLLRKNWMVWMNAPNKKLVREELSKALKTEYIKKPVYTSDGLI